MEFLHSFLNVALSEGQGKRHTVFAAKMLNKRPLWEELQGFRSFTVQWQSNFKESLARKTCPVSWLGIFIDTKGVWVLATSKSPQQVTDMKSSVHTVLKGQIAPEQLQEIGRTLHPLD